MRTIGSAVLMSLMILPVASTAQARSSGGAAHSIGTSRSIPNRAGTSLPNPAPGVSFSPALGSMSPRLRAADPPPSASPPSAPSSGSSASANASSLITAPPPPPPSAAAAPTPSSQIGQPTPQLPAIAPLSPQLPTQLSSGGTVTNNLALSPGSPSESAPSTPGGGGKSLGDCMGFWEPATHMTKAEWRAACMRTMQEYPNIR